MGRGSSTNQAVLNPNQRGNVQSPSSTADSVTREPITSLASLRRRLSEPGVRVITTFNSIKPEMVGVERTIESVSKAEIVFAPDATTNLQSSHLDMPKSAEFCAVDADSFSILRDADNPSLGYTLLDPDADRADVEAKIEAGREVSIEAKRLNDAKYQERKAARDAEIEKRLAARRAEKQRKEDELRIARDEARAKGHYVKGDSIEPYYEDYKRLRESGARYDADFEGKIPALQGPDENRAIGLLQDLHRQNERSEALAAVEADGFSDVSKPSPAARSYYVDYVIEPHKEVVCVDRNGEFRRYKDVRVVFDRKTQEPYTILKKGKRTHGVSPGIRVLVKD